MKYSLKNKQFRKRNNIFGQRRKEQQTNSQMYNDLGQIREIRQQSNESRFNTEHLTKTYSQSFNKHIIYQHQPREPQNNATYNQQKKISLQRLHSRHGLSPNHKPFINNQPVRLVEPKYGSKKISNLSLQSETIQFQFFSQAKQNDSQELKAVINKLYVIIMKNNSRVDQLQKLVLSMFQSGKILMRQANQGIGKMLKLQEKTNLFFNTMLNVYQNLRICRLKQDNIEMYLKQKKQQNEFVQPTNQTQFKYTRQRQKLSDLKKEMSLSIEDNQSKQLISLVDYDSNYQLSDNSSQQQHEQKSITRFKPNVNHTFMDKQIKQNVLNNVLQSKQFNFNRNKHFYQEQSPQLRQDCDQLSPFEANRLISVSKYSHMNSKNSEFQNISSNAKQSQYRGQSFQTFRTNNNNKQISNQYNKIREWIKKTGIKGLRCWLDEMNCLRRPNMTYIFYQNGEVISMSPQCFLNCVKQGYLIQVFDCL